MASIAMLPEAMFDHLSYFSPIQMSFSQSLGRIPSQLRARLEAKERRSGGTFRVPISQRRKLVVKRKRGWECGTSCPSDIANITVLESMKMGDFSPNEVGFGPANIEQSKRDL